MDHVRLDLLLQEAKERATVRLWFRSAVTRALIIRRNLNAGAEPIFPLEESNKMLAEALERKKAQ